MMVKLVNDGVRVQQCDLVEPFAVARANYLQIRICVTSTVLVQSTKKLLDQF